MDILDCTFGDEIFEWRNAATGEHAYFNATEIWKWVREHVDEVEYIVTPNTDDLRDLVFNKRGVEQWKIERLCEPYLSEPALAVLLPDGTTIHIDGNHRLARWFMRGDTEHKLIRVSFEQAKPFIIDGIPAGVILNQGDI